MSPDPARVELARFLHESGESTKQVSRLLGVSETTIRRWLNPDEAERDRVGSLEAKRRRTGICKTCGGVTRYSGKRNEKVSAECAKCARQRQHDGAYWTRERIIEAVQAWAAEHGKPPSAQDWLHADPDRRWPNRGSVYNAWSHGRRNTPPFTSWGDAIEAAGFPRPPTSYHGKAFERVWTEEKTIARLQSWAAEHGRSPREIDWRGRAEDRPTAGWVQQLFGSWNGGLTSAGLPLNGRWSRPTADAIVTRNATPKEATDEEAERGTTPTAPRRGVLARLARRRRT